MQLPLSKECQSSGQSCQMAQTWHKTEESDAVISRIFVVTFGLILN